MPYYRAVNGWRPRDRADWIGVVILAVMGLLFIVVLTRSSVGWQQAAPLAARPAVMENPDRPTYLEVGRLQFLGAFLGSLLGAGLTALAVYVTGNRSAIAQETASATAAEVQTAVANIQAQSARDLARDARRFELRRRQLEKFLEAAGKTVRHVEEYRLALRHHDRERMNEVREELMSARRASIDFSILGIRSPTMARAFKALWGAEETVGRVIGAPITTEPSAAKSRLEQLEVAQAAHSTALADLHTAAADYIYDLKD
jgi:hypothetical protein